MSEWSASPQTGIALAECIRKGDVAAEEEFVKWFSRRVLLAILTRIRDREAARDLTQDVVWAALCALRNGQLREPGKLAAFVHGIALNKVKNYFRTQARHPVEVPFPQKLPLASIPDEFDGSGNLKLVKEAVRGLDIADQEILRLTLVEGLKPGEIAQRLGMSPVVVRQRKSRAIKKVAERIGNMSRKPV